MSAKHKIAIIGAGNVAHHLAVNLKNAGHEIVQIYSRTTKSAKSLADIVETSFTTDTTKVTRDADVYLLTLNDDVINEVASKLELGKKIIAHTSATASLDVLRSSSENCGVLYPLQTISKGIDLDFSEVPLFIEASNRKSKEILELIAKSISKSVNYLDSSNRKALHVAAVFVNNFSNHLFHAAAKILSKEKLDFELLMPLIKETVRKIETSSPHKVQTGPAKRNDLKTIEEHLLYLDEFPDLKEIYLVMTESILQTNKENIPT